MLRIFQSNDMPALARLFTEQSQANPVDPFVPQTVVVQSYGMGQWLKLALSRTTGIAANIDCVLPADLVWRMYCRVLSNEAIPEQSPYTVEHLTWHLMGLLPTCTGERFQSVRDYLAGSGDDQVRAYQLGRKIAGLFDQYLIHRPEWILGWEQNDKRAPDSWQGDLWRLLRAQPELRGVPHRALLHRLLLERLGEAKPPGLPDPISVFGLSSLPRMHIETFSALSGHTDVDVYFLNPCQHYWGDIVSEKDKARRSIRGLLGTEAELSDDDYLDVGNPLLASLGKQGREYLELLLEIDDAHTIDAFVPATGDAMLPRIQRDILELEFGGEFGTGVEPKRTKPDADDLSIQIHSCHSKLREVEVLHDQLLRIIERDNTIAPADMIVMAPDVGEYAPYIDAVFKHQGKFRSYTIADRTISQESALVVAFLTLMGLPDSRLVSTEVMDLLEVPTIGRRFGLDETDLATITRWIGESGIRWELDGSSKSERWELPPSNHNTWQFGMDRLLLGYAMSGAPFAGVLPLTVEGSEAELLGTFCRFVELLGSWRKRLGVARPVAEWRGAILELLDDFFVGEGREELDLGLIREQLVDLENLCIQAGFRGPLSPRMVRHWLTEQLSDSGKRRGFISGGITFATLVPMRSIPFRVVCLLGLNDNEYPRQERPVTFDLMQANGFRKGDRSRRNDDRYLFLEALLSARDYLYLSYEGLGIKDNKEKPASVLVSEFLDYLTRLYDHDFVTAHPLQPFSDEYFSEERPDLVTYRKDWFDALTKNAPPQAFVDDSFAPDPLPSGAQLDRLARFFRNPAKFFLRESLNVFFEDDDIDLKETESFNLDGLERHGLADDALKTLLRGDTIESWQERSLLTGLVMEGDMGEAQLAREQQRATTVYETIADVVVHEPESITEVLDLGNEQLDGTVDHLYDNTLLNFRCGGLRERQIIEAWIKHLFANALGREVQTLLVSTDNKDGVVRHLMHALEPEEAKKLLTELVALYKEGCTTPLPFMPATSHAYANAIHNDKTADAAEDAALAKWQPYGGFGEGWEAEYCRFFDFPADFTERFADVAVAVWAPVLDRMEKLK